MHYIQSYILDSLVTSKYLRNKDMRPSGVESNLYQYHLLQLQKLGYIKKYKQTYTLSNKGLAYATKHSVELKKERTQPQILTILFVTNNKDELLIRTKQRQPFIGMQSLLMGKMHKNESLDTAAKREYKERVGEGPSPLFKLFSTAHISILQGDCVISDYIGLLVAATIPEHTLLKTNCSFYAVNTLRRETLAPGTLELIEAYKEKPKFIESRINLNDILYLNEI